MEVVAVPVEYGTGYTWINNMGIRPDGISFLSTLPNYINFDDATGSIAISGAIADGASQIFSTTISTSRNNTRFDVYGVNQNTSLKALFSNNTVPVIYQFVSLEAVNSFIGYTSTSIVVNIEVRNNTGSPINLVAQTIAVTVVQYQIPY